MRPATRNTALARVFRGFFLCAALVASTGTAAASDEPGAAAPSAKTILTTKDLVTEYDRLAEIYETLTARVDAAKARFLATLARRNSYSKIPDADPMILEGIEETYQVDIAAFERLHKERDLIDTKMDILAEIIDEAYLPLLDVVPSPGDSAAMGRKEEALGWAEKRHGSGALLSPAGQWKPRYRPQSDVPETRPDTANPIVRSI